MLHKPNLTNLIPISPLLDRHILIFEAANQGFVSRFLLNRESFDYIIYTFAYSQIQRQFKEINDEHVDQAKACFRVLIGSLMKSNYKEWSKGKQRHFAEMAKKEFKIATAIHEEEKDEREQLGENFQAIRSIRKTLQQRGYYDEVSEGWNELSSKAWDEMILIIEEDKKSPEICRSQETWYSIIEAATALN